MKKITIELDTWGHKELNDYLLTVKGINSVTTKDEKNISVMINYDPTIINEKMIRLELDLFFNTSKEPSMISFDKHEKADNKYQIIIKYLCCEYCLKGMIEDLYEKDGIVSAKSDFDFIHVDKRNYENVTIDITYNNKIDLKQIKELEIEFNK